MIIFPNRYWEPVGDGLWASRPPTDQELSKRRLVESMLSATPENREALVKRLEDLKKQ